MTKIRKSENKKLLKLANKFEPWDYEFMLDLERESLIKMRDYHANHNIIADNGNTKIANEINLAIKLLDIGTGKNCSYDVYTEKSRIYVNHKNYKRFLRGEYKKFSPVLLDMIRVEKAWYLYNKMRIGLMKRWWD